LTPENLHTILKNGENERVEFKTSFNGETIETLVAFANTKGGNVYLGITDNGRITGVVIGKETLAQWLNEIKTKTSPALYPDFEIINNNEIGRAHV
jgi:ATP-dependent DNA helicase RecG